METKAFFENPYKPAGMKLKKNPHKTGYCVLAYSFFNEKCFTFVATLLN